MDIYCISCNILHINLQKMYNLCDILQKNENSKMLISPSRRGQLLSCYCWRSFLWVASYFFLCFLNRA